MLLLKVLHECMIVPCTIHRARDAVCLAAIFWSIRLGFEERLPSRGSNLHFRLSTQDVNSRCSKRPNLIPCLVRPHGLCSPVWYVHTTGVFTRLMCSLVSCVPPSDVFTRLGGFRREPNSPVGAAEADLRAEREHGEIMSGEKYKVRNTVVLSINRAMIMVKDSTTFCKEWRLKHILVFTDRGPGFSN